MDDGQITELIRIMQTEHCDAARAAAMDGISIAVAQRHLADYDPRRKCFLRERMTG